MSTYPPTYIGASAMLGRYVIVGKPMSPGLQALLSKILFKDKLNTLSSTELRLLHAILCHLYNFTTNCYLFKYALYNTGTYDNGVLGRKVPIQFWTLLYEVCLESGLTTKDLTDETVAASLWYRLNTADDGTLCGFCEKIFKKLGLTHHVALDLVNLRDGNLLFNLGSTIPCRLLMCLLFCLKNWGAQGLEPWVRHYVGKFFLLYLILAGYLLPRKECVEFAATQSYAGLMETICADILTFQGSQALSLPPDNYLQELDQLFTFNNSFISYTTATVTGSAPNTQK
ncbi:hypothetical protein [Murine herpesvirus strain 4556]|uniref:18 protein n=2 Tax=Orthoherpesviridae TaxID=3044472 RepID=O41937_MHV68|nr:unknown [Murid gammaherpesvirus 4]AXP99078.1 unknown protein [synthetic construct]QJQ80209.2 hypothetical protein MuHV4gp16 [Murine herpesvirus]UNZ86647.1 hypothetical protein [Murine herpesvirus strain 72]UNZ86724.1 hypothetical protein [Murine herpesvirus strain 4556]AAB66393.1 unknown [Murid gammaherpesvirus 4]